jgi:hypothetical protein
LALATDGELSRDGLGEWCFTLVVIMNEPVSYNPGPVRLSRDTALMAAVLEVPCVAAALLLSPLFLLGGVVVVAKAALRDPVGPKRTGVPCTHLAAS